MFDITLKTIAKTIVSLLLSFLLSLGILLPGLGTLPARAQNAPFSACEGFAFSTEEDFLAQGSIPPDGNPIISDGDLLTRKFSGGVDVCARNRDLLAVFQSEVDLGLDAVDVIQSQEFLIAFSTELDDPNNQFTAGDLLATNGAVIPNNALMVKFDQPIPVNIGLDAVQFVGATENIIEFLNIVVEQGRDFWQENPSALVEFLEQFDIDILFSTEGTGTFPEKPLFLDGDLLSARNGTIVTANSDFLPTLPAGLPQRGADFGLDAFTFGQDPIEQVDVNLFSTEIVSLEQPLTFTDGDVLQEGAGIFLKNIGLVEGFEPVTTDLGLDALDFVGIIDEIACLPRITAVGGFDVSLINNTTGYARQQDSVSSPLPPPPAPLPFDSPFGRWVSIRGQVPGPECVNVNQYEYRVEYQNRDDPAETWVPIIIDSGWQFNGSPFCSFIPIWQPYASDGNGWIPLADYWLARNTCRPDQVLNEWNTNGINGRYKLRLSVREIGDPTSETMSSEVPVVIDNTAPQPVEMNLYNADGTELLANQCEISGSESPTVITIKGRVRDNGQGSPMDGDEHFRAYSLAWTGGDVHSFVGISIPRSERYYDAGRPELDGSGTLPATATDVPLATFNFADAYRARTGEDPIKCGYTIRLTGTDRTILGRFRPGENLVTDRSGIGLSNSYLQSFCFTPLEELEE